MKNTAYTWLFDHADEFRERHSHHHRHRNFLLLTIVLETGEWDVIPFVRKGEREMMPVHRKLSGPTVEPSVTFNVGHVATMVIVQLDTNGNPMLVPITFDSAAVWTQATPATDTLAPAADGNSATATAVAAGTDTITCTAMFQGVAFVAQQPLTVTPAPQVFGGIALMTTVQ